MITFSRQRCQLELPNSPCHSQLSLMHTLRWPLLWARTCIQEHTKVLQLSILLGLKGAEQAQQHPLTCQAGQRRQVCEQP